MADNDQRTPGGGVGGETKARGFRRLLRVFHPRVLLVILAPAALAVFIVQNTGDIEVDFLSWDLNVPLYLLLLITAGLAVIVTEIVGWYRYRRRLRRLL